MQETWVRSLGWEDSPGEGKGYPLQYTGLENSMGSLWGHKELDTSERVSHSLFWLEVNGMPGASVRNSAHGKGREEGGLAYAKA